MPYAQTTWASLRTQLSQRLDELLVFWTDEELAVYLTEALRTWNSLSGYWRQRAVVPTVSGQAYYNLPALPGLLGLFDFTVTVRQMVNQLQYALMETINAWPPNTWQGTDMFTMADLVGALQRRRNQFLLDSACVQSQELVAVGPVPPAGRFDLPESYITVRRAAWKTVAGVYTPLWRSDEWGFNAFAPTWMQTPAKPRNFSISMTPPVMMQLAPVPLDAGNVDLVSVRIGAELDVDANTLMGIPDDFCWIVKYGAMADLLSKEGEAYDPVRAEYCQQRYAQGVNLARLMPSIMNFQIQDRPAHLDAIYDWDVFDPSWQNSSGTPKRAAMLGFTMFAVKSIPDDVYSLSFDLLRKAPIPVLDADFVQLGEEQIDTILDLAEHIARFKQGGAEFSTTVQLYKNTLEQAKIYNGAIMEASPFKDVLTDRARQDEDKVPSRRPRPVEVAQ